MNSSAATIKNELYQIARQSGTTFEEVINPTPGRTHLGRLHQAMVLYAIGEMFALKKFLTNHADATMWKLAQSLFSIYPKGSDERGWLDGLLAHKKSMKF